MTSRKKKTGIKAGGPYLAAALFCDSVLHGTDGSLSAIRIVDQMALKLSADAPDGVPSESKRLPASVWALLAFKTGYGKPGKHDVKLVLHSPSGKRRVIGQYSPIFTEKPTGGANLKINLVIGIKEGGLFWVDVVLDGMVVTRMPLQISVERMQQSGLPPTPPGGELAAVSGVIEKRRKPKPKKPPTSRRRS